MWVERRGFLFNTVRKQKSPFLWSACYFWFVLVLMKKNLPEIDLLVGLTLEHLIPKDTFENSSSLRPTSGST